MVGCNVGGISSNRHRCGEERHLPSGWGFVGEFDRSEVQFVGGPQISDVNSRIQRMFVKSYACNVAVNIRAELYAKLHRTLVGTRGPGRIKPGGPYVARAIEVAWRAHRHFNVIGLAFRRGFQVAEIVECPGKNSNGPLLGRYPVKGPVGRSHCRLPSRSSIN